MRVVTIILNLIVGIAAVFVGITSNDFYEGRFGGHQLGKRIPVWLGRIYPRRKRFWADAFVGWVRRVEKLLNGNLTVFVYDALGQLSAEYDSDNTPTPFCQTCYLVQDVVGSTHLMTDNIGRVVTRHDFLPLGEGAAGHGRLG